MKKKLLLVGVAAMGLLAVGVGATSTFAWYQANARTGQVKQLNSENAVTVSDPHYTAETVDLPISTQITRVNTDADTECTTALELTHYYAAKGLNGQKNTSDVTWVADSNDSPAGWYQAYYKTTDKSSIRFTTSLAASHINFAIYKIEVKVTFPSDADDVAPVVGTSSGFIKPEEDVLWQDKNGNTWDIDAVVTELATKSAKFSLTGGASSRAMFFGASSSTKPSALPSDGSGCAASVSASAETTKALTGLNKTTFIPLGFFGMYVDGVNGHESEAATTNRVDESVNGNFIVTIEKAS